MRKRHNAWWARAAIVVHHYHWFGVLAVLTIGAIGGAFEHVEKARNEGRNFYSDPEFLGALPLMAFVLLLAFLLGRHLRRSNERRDAERRDIQLLYDHVLFEIDPQRWRERIVFPSDDEPRVRNTNIRAVHVVAAFSTGVSKAEVLGQFPDLDENDVDACIDYAAWRSKRSHTPG